MIKNLSPKTIALAIISFVVLLMSGIAIETTKGALFEIRNSLAAMEAAKASNKAAEAATLDAINKLEGTIATARAMNNVGQLQANATIAAANQIAAATVKAAETNMYPDITAYDSMTGPLLGEPTKEIARLNKQIGHLRQKAQHSTDDGERVKYETQVAQLEEEKEIVGQTASQNFGDMMHLVVGGVFQSFAGAGNPLAKR